ncbi:MAG: S-methyl-5-thioribose-1-phosphate isomerase [Nitrospirae bacterium RIFCSPLOWO2_02_42_7]|nr:MAG: S-methyl-5-thioribose-1-phosphate isomerase [Nitrospirae bacterium RIFCSPLOWO2_02_42_7]
MVPTIEWKDGIVRMLDQTRLPLEVTFFDCRTYHDVAKGIKDLIIRGAPAIGVAAAMGVALGAQEINTKNFKNFYDELEKVCNHIGSTRPTAVNLFWAINRMKEFTLYNKEKPISEIKKALIDEANRILQEDIEACKTMGRHGAQFIKDGDTILTHCNAGALATGGYGTALGVIRAAKEEGKEIKVFADETRPVLQGARLTAWELMEDGIAVTLITDNMAGYFMKKGMINLCIVGADRIARNGDVANKIGTYSVAVLAREHGIPFYVAAPLSTIDFNIPSGEHIPIEERNPAEVSHIFGKTQIAPSKVRILNPAFDVTPARYIAAIITEKGCFKPEDIGRLK